MNFNKVFKKFVILGWTLNEKYNNWLLTIKSELILLIYLILH